ncbi:MAG: PP2C family protein-serine/threonine phosphatase [Candidatus Omnitrophica bacterium]|nr:PP2C family protein-serine/threonine phosphatase [Candidatus Omnitrophota bacterium]
MRKIKILTLFLIISFLCQNVSFGTPERNSALRPPSQFGNPAFEKEVNTLKAKLEEASARKPMGSSISPDIVRQKLMDDPGKAVDIIDQRMMSVNLLTAELQDPFGFDKAFPNFKQEVKFVSELIRGTDVQTILSEVKSLYKSDRPLPDVERIEFRKWTKGLIRDDTTGLDIFEAAYIKDRVMYIYITSPEYFVAVFCLIYEKLILPLDPTITEEQLKANVPHTLAMLAESAFSRYLSETETAERQFRFMPLEDWHDGKLSTAQFVERYEDVKNEIIERKFPVTPDMPDPELTKARQKYALYYAEDLHENADYQVTSVRERIERRLKRSREIELADKNIPEFQAGSTSYKLPQGNEAIVSFASAKGSNRPRQEDRFVNARIELSDIKHGKGQVMAVMDGHGGPDTAEKVKNILQATFETALKEKEGNVENALRHMVNLLYEATKDDETGTTLSVVYVPDDELRAYVAFLGDSPIVIKGKHGVYTNSDKMHNVTWNISERNAAIQRGAAYREKKAYDLRAGYIGFGGVELQMSRALGDKSLAPVLNYEPEITSVELDEKSVIALFVGSDGLYNSYNPDAASQLNQTLKEVLTGRSAEVIVKGALTKTNGVDNTTLVTWKTTIEQPPIATPSIVNGLPQIIRTCP